MSTQIFWSITEMCRSGLIATALCSQVTSVVPTFQATGTFPVCIEIPADTFDHEYGSASSIGGELVKMTIHEDGRVERESVGRFELLCVPHIGTVKCCHNLTADNVLGLQLNVTK